MAEVTIENLPRLIQKLKRIVAKARMHNAVIVVSFQTSYALYVHENMNAHHPVGQAKFLEQPARELRPHMQAMVVKNMRRGLSLPDALMLVGLFLQREAQALTPVDTAMLRNSAATTRES